MLKNKTLRLVVLVTYNCNFDCMYCCVPRELRRKRNMPKKYLLKSIDFLLSSKKNDLQLHFFGAEPLLLRYDIYSEVFHYAYEKSRRLNKNLRLIITTNGALFNQKWIDLFKKFDISLEISLDGGPRSHNLNRPQRRKGNSYDKVTQHLPLIFDSGIDVQVSMVISPQTCANVYENYLHLAKLGFKKIFMMVANCVYWPTEGLATLRDQLAIIRHDYPSILLEYPHLLLNLRDWVTPMRMNTELSVDVDGSVYSACVGYLAKDPKVKKRWTLANIDNVEHAIDHYEPLRLSNEEGMDIVFTESEAYGTLSSCIQAGNIMADFVARLRDELNKIMPQQYL